MQSGTKSKIAFSPCDILVGMDPGDNRAANQRVQHGKKISHDRKVTTPILHDADGAYESEGDCPDTCEDDLAVWDF